MDKQSSSINQWTKGSNSDSISTLKNEFNNKTASNYNSFEFLDMSSCDESQKLKLKNTLSSPSSFSTQRDQIRSNFAIRNSSMKPTQQQYSTIQYHANNNSKSQKPNYQFYQTKHPSPVEHEVMRHVSLSTRSFSSEANHFHSKNNSNFNNNTTTMSNTTNLSSKRLDENRHFPSTQEKLRKWHSNNKKPPYVGVKEPIQVNIKDQTLAARSSGSSYHTQIQTKESSRDPNKNFSSCNRNMSPPLTNFQTNTTTSTTTSPSNQSSGSVPHQTHLAQTTAHYNHQQIPYGTTLHPQMYPSGNVPFIQHYPMPGFIPTPHGQQLIPQTFIPHGDRSDLSGRDANIGIQEHQSNSQHAMNSTRGSSGIGRRGRSRGGNNSMSRRDFSMRQNNQHQQQQQQNQSSITSNEYGQPLMDQNQAVLASSGPYQQLYIHYSPYYPNAGGPHLTALPASASAANAQNLTGQPLFAIQQPLHMYPYGSYPIMYNMMPTQAHPMTHQTTDLVDNEHNQNQDPNGTPTIIQSLPWPPHVAYQDPQHIFQHSPQLNPGEELEFRVSHPEEYHLQMINHANTSYHILAPEQNDVVNEILQVDSTLQQDGSTLIENEPIYHQEAAENGGDTRILIEKTRDLMIQPSIEEVSKPQLLNSQKAEGYLAVSSEKNKTLLDTAVPNPRESESFLPNSPARLGININFETEPTKSVSSSSKKNCTVDNKMIVKNKEKPPAWGNVAVPNLGAQTSSVKKQMASVSVSAIPNKDVVHLQHASEIATQTNDQTMDAQEAVQDQHFSNQTSFSSITASKLPLSTIVVNKKTEKKQNEIQPLQKQMALSERVKQQIVTTITGVGAVSQEINKKQDAAVSRCQQASMENVQVSAENTTQASKALPSAPQHVGSARASWAGLFVSAESLSAASKATSPPPAPSSSPLHNLNTENQTKISAKSYPEQLSVHVTPQVPGVMSYSAVSAQSMLASSQNYTAPVPLIASQISTGGLLKSKKLPHSKSDSSSVDNNIGNNSKPTPVDQHALRLGEFFSKYKIESNSISLLPRGLLNKSNYCYINATLQALVACPPFYHLMKAIPQMPSTYRNQTKTPVTDAMVELVSNYSQLPFRKWVPREKGKKDEVPEISRDAAFEPTVILKVLQALRTNMFPIEGRQEDAEEFLSFILNRMNDEMIELKKLVEKPKLLPKKEETCEEVNGNIDVSVDDDEEWQVISGARNKSTITRTTDFGRSPISDIFGGKLRLRVHREGDHSSDNIEPFFTLKLVIEKASSVREALEILVGRDQLEGVTCSRTNQEVAAWQQVTLEELPVVLILHLKCFDFKKESCNKILKTVEFPVELKIDQKIMASKNKYQQKQKQYKLFAVVYHDGKEVSKGHYITDVFHVGYSSWIRYDDSTVKAVPESNVLHPKSPRVPYLLYYRRYDTIGGNRDHNCNNHQNNQKSTK